MVSLIAAMTPQRVIGRNGAMPWHLPADLAWFRQKTLGKPVIMGRKTWESIGCKPLPKRQNIILSRATELAGKTEQAYLAHSPEHALQLSTTADEVMVIGGGEIYTKFLPQTERLYITLIHVDLEGDSYFPAYQHLCWQEIYRTEREADDQNPFDCSFMILERTF